MLELDDIHVQYGNIRSLRGVSLRVAEGELVALIGSNGAGKTTTLRTISALLRPSRGTITFEGAQIQRASTDRIVALGISHCPEGRRIFGSLTVRENLVLGAVSRSDRAAAATELEMVFGLFPLLKERLNQAGGTLSGGEQQMLAIGRALMARPRLILMDEPSMGLSPLLVLEVFAIIRRLNRDLGISILLVEQNANMALKAADYGYIMEGGKVVLDGPAESLMNNEDVKEFYLGGGSGERRSFKNLKSFKRRKRWL